MTMPMARSTTLPLRANSLNSFSMALLRLMVLDLPGGASAAPSAGCDLARDGPRYRSERRSDHPSAQALHRSSQAFRASSDRPMDKSARKAKIRHGRDRYRHPRRARLPRLLFAVASYGDRAKPRWMTGAGRQTIYALSLGVYCTSWTFFGAVGLASRSGFDFLTIYIGPLIMIGLVPPPGDAGGAARQGPEHHLDRRLHRGPLRQEPAGRGHRHGQRR